MFRLFVLLQLLIICTAFHVPGNVRKVVRNPLSGDVKERSNRIFIIRRPGGGGSGNRVGESGPPNVQEFIQTALQETNAYRGKHQVEPLTLSDDLNRHAQEWADKLAQSGSFSHRPNNPYGENLAMGTGETWKQAVKMWYDEVGQYNFGSPGFSSGTGHFTQLVWKGSKKVGFGVAAGSNGATYVVANYDPPGNVMGQFPQNVFPARA